jgi:hypothetical protein
MKRNRYEPAVPPAVKEALKGRAGGSCEMQLPGCLGRGTDPSHRIGTKAGGRKGEAKERHNRLSNVVWACRACHDWCHARPAEAKDAGLMLEEWQNPEDVPVTRRCQLVYLYDDGTWTEACW